VDDRAGHDGPAAQLFGVGAVGDERRAAGLGGGAVDPGVPDDPDGPVGVRGAQERQAGRVGLERGLVPGDDGHEELPEAAPGQGDLGGPPGIVGPHGERDPRAGERLDRLPRAGLASGALECRGLVRDDPRPAGGLEPRVVGREVADRLRDRPAQGRLRQGDAVPGRQRTDLGPDGPEVERRADQGVIQVEDAEHRHAFGV
jgi:hypothetical protein